MAPLQLKGNTLDLSKEKPVTNAATTNYILVEFKSPLGKTEYESLKKYQCTVEEYVGQDTYLCIYPPHDLNKLKELSFVGNVTVYPTKVKVSPEVQQAVQAQQSAGAQAKPEPKSIQVHLHEGIEGGYQKVLQKISAITKPVVIGSNNVLLRITVDIKFVPDIANLDEVRSIGLDIPDEPDNTMARGVMNLPSDFGGSNQQLLDGKGQIVTVADTGFNKGNLTDVHPAFQNRVIKLFAISRESEGLTNDPDGHGTHVCGSVAANGTSPETGSVVGTAPGAQLIVQSLLNPTNGKLDFPSRTELMIQAINEGSYIHSCSFGISGKEPYSAVAEEIDTVIYSKPEFLVCQSAGNDGDEGGKVNGAAGMKNGIVVGASYNARNVSTSGFDEDGTVADPHNMVAWSNPGPDVGGFIRPHVVAPGFAILSTASQDPAFQAAARKLGGFITIPGTRRINKGGKAPNDLYCFASGTSMATPLVSGCLAVLRQALLRRSEAEASAHDPAIKQPKASLVKALLIHGCTDLATGTYQKKPIGPAPNLIQGFGLVNMELSLAPVLDTNKETHGIWEDKVESISKPASFMRWTPAPPSGGKPEVYDLLLTLVYTDMPGKELQSALVFDVTIESGTQKGRIFSSGRNDNALKLRCPDVPGDTTFNVTVQAQRLLKGDSQAFSLVWSSLKK